MTILTPAARPPRYRRWRRRATVRPTTSAAARDRRLTGWLGLLSIPLILFGTTLALPGADQSAAKIAAFYSDERMAVLVSQAFAIGAAAVFFAFAGRLPRAIARFDQPTVLAWMGRSVAIVTLGAAMAVAFLAIAASPDRPDLTLMLASAVEAMGTFQLLTMVGFVGLIAIADVDLSIAFRALAGVVALLTLSATAARWAGETSSLGVVAPLAFVTFIGVLALWLVFDSEPHRVDRVGRG